MKWMKKCLHYLTISSRSFLWASPAGFPVSVSIQQKRQQCHSASTPCISPRKRLKSVLIPESGELGKVRKTLQRHNLKSEAEGRYPFYMPLLSFLPFFLPHSLLEVLYQCSRSGAQSTISLLLLFCQLICPFLWQKQSGGRVLSSPPALCLSRS